MSYVDDLIVIGNNPQILFDKIQQKLLLKPTGELKAGASIKFLGRQLSHCGDRIEITSPKDYLDSTFLEYNLPVSYTHLTLPTTPYV